MGVNFNRHARNSYNRFENVDESFDFRDKNDATNPILGLFISYDLIVANIRFKKLDFHLIDFFFTKTLDCSKH